MTDYTKNASFTAKTGTPIAGADFDSEFDEIATAVASKEDKASKGVANGYCGLDSGGLVDASDLPAAIAYLNAAAAFASSVTIGTTLGVSGATTLAALSATTGAFSGTLNVTGTLTGGAGAFTSMTIGGVSVLTTSSGLNASNINSGSIGNAYVPVGAVTQHQASLSIAETQIADGSVFPRIGVAETITGAWSFSAAGTITRSGQGRFTYLNGSGNTGGAITLSTLDPSGTPAAGDIWIKYTA